MFSLTSWHVAAHWQARCAGVRLNRLCLAVWSQRAVLGPISTWVGLESSTVHTRLQEIVLSFWSSIAVTRQREGHTHLQNWVNNCGNWKILVSAQQRITHKQFIFKIRFQVFSENANWRERVRLLLNSWVFLTGICCWKCVKIEIYYNFFNAEKENNWSNDVWFLGTVEFYQFCCPEPLSWNIRGQCVSGRWI